MSIVEIEYEREPDFEDKSNTSPSHVSELSLSDCLNKKEITPHDCIAEFNGLQNEHETNNTIWSACGALVTVFLPNQLWILPVSLHASGIGPKMLAYFLCTLLSLMFTGITAEASCLRFTWIKKWLMKNKKFKINEEKFEQFKNNLENALSGEDFKHQYLAHFQLHMNHYTELINQWSEKKELHFNRIQWLQGHLHQLARHQADLIRAFSLQESVKDSFRQKVILNETIIQIQKIEKEIMAMNTYIKESQGYQDSDEEFLKRYQKYLEKVDLTHLMQPASEKENHQLSEEKMKQQINQKL
jgi:hypothetical protein